MSDNGRSTTSQPSGRLRGGAIGALGAAVISMAFMGPATSVAFNTPPGAAKIGYALPVGILLAMLVCLITASTIGAFTSKLPSAGFAFTFNTHALGKGTGFVSGWLLGISYAAVGPMLFAAIGSFGSSFVEVQFHWHVPWWVISGVMMLIIWFIGSRGVTSSVKTALVFLTLEVVILLLLFATIVFKGGAEGNSIQPFNPGNSLHGVNGIGLGVLWGILMFVGFESAGTLSEETRDARRNVQRALFAAVIMVGLVYVLSGYAAAIGFGKSHSNALASDASPWTTLTDTYWGKDLAWLFTLTVLNSQFANALSGSTAAVRIIFAMGREGVIGRVLGRTNGHDSPGVAWAAYVGFSALVTYGAGAAMGPLGVYAFMGSFLGLGIIIIYIMMNVGLTSYFWRKHRGEFNWLRHGILPSIGSLLMLLPIYGLVWPVPNWPYSLVPYLLAIWIIVGVVYFAAMRSRNPRVVAAMGRVWESESPTDDSTAVSDSTAPGAMASSVDGSRKQT